MSVLGIFQCGVRHFGLCQDGGDKDLVAKKDKSETVSVLLLKREKKMLVLSHVEESCVIALLASCINGHNPCANGELLLFSKPSTAKSLTALISEFISCP